jgi:hypothetical protein
MSSIEGRFQQGQAMTEFVIAMAVVVPLALGVIYVGKYQDVKYSAIQASRYTAFERVFDPSSAHKNATVLAEETRERFFTDPTQNNQGAVAFQDSTQGKQTQNTLNANWYGTGAEPVINQYSDIAVNVQNPGVTGIPNQALDGIAKLNFNINDPGIQKAEVTVPLAKVAHFEPLNRVNLKIDVSTAVLADGYNAGGATSPAANNVRDRVFYDWGIFLGKIPGLKPLLDVIDSSIVSLGWEVLSDTPGPQWGCVSPDVVPSDATSPSAQYDPTQVCN